MKRILFVCMGNICRSPAAESIMNSLLEKHQLTQHFECDSAGTSDYHVGEKTDQRMIDHGSKRNYSFTHRARHFTAPDDFVNFDYIFAMDNANLRNILSQDPQALYKGKIRKMTDLCTRHDHSEVPDPYYGGPMGFDLVLDILEDACENFLTQIAK